jgi:aminoglycoside phosphotransferase family enzyme/predicted kinase
MAEAALPLAARLTDPRCFPHPAAAIELIETHISWVVLAGDYAYKLKKPLDLGFLDFSTLAKRRAACDEEVRLNRRLAPELYLDVVAVTDGPGGPRIGGVGPAAEYAVRMRRFDRAQELDRLLRADALPAERVDELARLVARFHADIPRAGDADPWGTPEAALAIAAANFDHVQALEHGPGIAERVAALQAWTLAEHARITPLLRARKRDGLVRECHGDLHLANMVLHGGRVVVFDCIEFNPALRWIDVMAEVAFTVMDLRHRGHRDLAQRFLNDYLEETGDYAGLAVLRYFLVYRAMVRAKIAAIRGAQATGDLADREHADFRAHLGLAEAFARPAGGAVVITCGASGSGKSHLARELAATGDWIRVRSDVERKRMAGLAPTARTESGVGTGLYATAMGDRTYARLAELARTVIRAQYPVIVDATFLARAQRQALREVAAAMRVPFALLVPTTSEANMRERVAARAAAGADPSEATVEVLERQLRTAERLADDEAPYAAFIDTSGPVDREALAAAVAARLRP